MSERNLALFDFDKTVYKIHSLFGLIAYYENVGLVRVGIMEEVQNVANNFNHKEGQFRSTADEILHILAEALKGQSFKDAVNKTREFFEQNEVNFYSYFAKILPELKRNYDVWLVTQSSQMVGEVICDKYGLTGFLSTEFEVKDGKFTGKILKSFVNGKAEVAELVKKYTGNSLAVGDSENDIEMLAAVNNPLGINPSSGLAKVAQERDWKIMSDINASETILGLLKSMDK